MNSPCMKRGALIVFEGCDKAGKTTQCKKLVEKLVNLGLKAEFMQFPDRTTTTGKVINDYLSNKQELSDEAIHLLFTANRWERQPKIKKLILSGVTVVVDRYSYSGVAYSAAKPGMSLEWCKKAEIGLPKPDLVFLLKASSNSSNRTGFGDERYERKEFLKEVYKNFLKMKDQTWTEIDASKSIEEIHEDLLVIVRDVIQRVQTEKLEELW